MPQVCHCKQQLGSICVSAHSCETATYAHTATESTEVQSGEETKPTVTTPPPLCMQRAPSILNTAPHSPITSECRYGVLGKVRHSPAGRLKIMELQAEWKGLTHSSDKSWEKKQHTGDKILCLVDWPCVFVCVHTRGTQSSARPPSVLPILCTCDAAWLRIWGWCKKRETLRLDMQANNTHAISLVLARLYFLSQLPEL